MFEVRQFTVCDGWVNNWFETDENGKEGPLRFDSEDHAQDAINSFLYLIGKEIERGERQPDEGYSAEEFRIVEVL